MRASPGLGGHHGKGGPGLALIKRANYIIVSLSDSVSELNLPTQGPNAQCARSDM